MQLESGTTGERRTRVLIFLVMCTAFTLWFAYDGFIGYPGKNLEWARQALPQQPSSLHADPRVNSANLAELARQSKTLERSELEKLLGPPAVEQTRELRYLGPDLAVTVRVENGKIAGVAADEVKGEPPANANFRVRRERLERLQPGAPESLVRDELGEPTSVQEPRLWFVGPAAYASVEVSETGRILGEPTVRKNSEPSESDILVQKVIAAVLAVVTVFVLISFIRVLTLKVSLDDEGLVFRGKRIRYDEMTALRTENYSSKGWVDLEYTRDGRSRRQRLDSYHIDRFQEILDALCDRKGFSLPAAPAAAEDL